MPETPRDGGGATQQTSTIFPFLTVNEAAASLRMSRPTIYRRMQERKIRFVIEGGRRLIPTSEIERYGAQILEAAGVAA